MKKSIFVFILISCSLFSISQSEIPLENNRLKFGFNIGLNQPNLLYGDEAAIASVTNKLGFRIGILADYKIFNALSVSPKAELSFNESQVNFVNTEGTESSYDVLPVSLEFMTHFIIKKSNENISPYFYFGPNVKIPLSEETENTTKFSTRTDFAIDFGIGMNKAFSKFNFAPELRYSYGLLNVNQHPAIESLNIHTASLIFNFLD